MPQRLRVIQLGLGPIGLEAARLTFSRSDLELVGAVDVDPRLGGRDLGDLLEIPDRTGVIVQSDLASALEREGPDIVFQTTGSRLADVMGQIEQVVRHGANLASTTEELFFPHRRHPVEAARIDSLAREQGVSVLGTGVNPGFAMDTLALCLSAVCRRIDSVGIRRVVDAMTRRAPLQRKIGAGLPVEEFRAKVARKELGHVGLVESLDLLAAVLGLVVDEVEETIEPVVATQAIRTSHATVEPEQVAGIHHTALGRSAGRLRISLDLRMYLGAPSPHDEIAIEGDPPIRNRVEGGIAGDAATAAILVNCAGRVVAAPPGLRTIAEVPIITCGT